jgi:hypothetical protein
MSYRQVPLFVADHSHCPCVQSGWSDAANLLDSGSLGAALFSWDSRNGRIDYWQARFWSPTGCREAKSHASKRPVVSQEAQLGVTPPAKHFDRNGRM